MIVVPITQKEAKEFVRRIHRHLKPALGSIFQIAVADSETMKIVGVAMVGRPVSRFLDDGWTLEVNRTATDGTRNANSKLYGAAWRVARNLGYLKLITYTLKEESGSSLRGAGWKCLGEAGSARGSWSCKSRPRVDLQPQQMKFKWEMS